MFVRALKLASLLTAIALPFTFSFMFSACGDNEKVLILPCPKDAAGIEECQDADAGAAGGGGDSGSAGGGGMSGASCPGQCIALPPDGWSDPRLLWVGPEVTAPQECPPQAPVLAWTGHDGLHADVLQCDACGCDPPSGTCSPPATFTAHGALCYQGGVDTSFDPPAPWDGTCTDVNPIKMGEQCPMNSGVLCVQSVTVGKLVLTENKCKPSFQPPPKVLTAPEWNLLGIACKGSVENASCGDPSKICVPTAEPPPPGYLQCVYQDGDIPTCPAEFPYRTLLYADYSDTRQCTPCGCGDPDGSLCMGMATIYRDTFCNDLIDTSIPTSQFAPCHDLPPGSALGSKMVTGLAYTPGSCKPTGGEPIGEAIPVEPRTFCCMA